MVWDGQERRSFIRLNANVGISYTKYDSSEKDKFSLAKNISKDGMCLVVYEELKKSDLIDLQIYLSKGKTPIDVRGKVVWVKEFTLGSTPIEKRFNAGIEFIKIDEEDRKKIDEFISSVM